MKKLTTSNYSEDRLYLPRPRAMAEILAAGGVVAPIDVLLRLGRITKERYEDWRFGRVAYLERVCVGNLGQLNPHPADHRAKGPVAGAAALADRLSQMGPRG